MLLEDQGVTLADHQVSPTATLDDVAAISTVDVVGTFFTEESTPFPA